MGKKEMKFELLEEEKIVYNFNPKVDYIEYSFAIISLIIGIGFLIYGFLFLLLFEIFIFFIILIGLICLISFAFFLKHIIRLIDTKYYITTLRVIKFIKEKIKEEIYLKDIVSIIKSSVGIKIIQIEPNEKKINLLINVDIENPVNFSEFYKEVIKYLMKGRKQSSIKDLKKRVQKWELELQNLEFQNYQKKELQNIKKEILRKIKIYRREIKEIHHETF